MHRPNLQLASQFDLTGHLRREPTSALPSVSPVRSNCSAANSSAFTIARPSLWVPSSSAATSRTLPSSSPNMRRSRSSLVRFESRLVWTVSNAVAAYLLDEHILPLIQMSHKQHLASTKSMAINSVFATAFHRGLGEPVAPTSSSYKNYLDAETLQAYHTGAFDKSNFAIVGNGADQADFGKWTKEFFGEYRAEVASRPSLAPLPATQSKYYGGEERISHAGGNSMVIAFPGSSSFTGGFYKPEISVLASLLGGQSSIKWSPGFSLLSKQKTSSGPSVVTKSEIFSDAGLLTVAIDGSAESVSNFSKTVMGALKSVANGEVSQEDMAKAVAQSKFKELEYGSGLYAALELTGAGLIHQGKPYQLDDSAKALESVTADKVVQVSFSRPWD
jgi:ubiquinol-cytochrome c reductase core subunit 2